MGTTRIPPWPTVFSSVGLAGTGVPVRVGEAVEGLLGTGVTVLVGIFEGCMVALGVKVLLAV
jgi:hypothetical protein